MLENFTTILEERRQRECGKKIPYKSMQAATRARKRMEKLHVGQIFDEYSCPFCGNFHVGHAKNKNPKDKKQNDK